MLGSSESISGSSSLFHFTDQSAKLLRRSEVPRARVLEVPRTAPRIIPTTRQVDPAVKRARDELLSVYAPPTVLVRSDLDVAHTFGDVSAFLKVPVGQARLSLPAMLPLGAGTMVGVLVQRCLRTGESATATVPGQVADEPPVRVDARPVREAGQPARMALVSFSKQEAPASPGGGTDHVDLEAELAHTRDSLQATVEELEASNEELQSTNEELLASNEELQSTNEELQSVNEELHTLNAEYQHKIDELSRANDDLDNLLRSTTQGIVFLDDELRVRRFTPEATTFLNLLPHDVGRPISHITSRVPSPDLAAVAQEVLRTRAPHSEELQGNGIHVVLQLRPYVSSHLAGGVLISFLEVTLVHRERQHIQSILNGLPMQVAVLDGEGVIRSVNEPWKDFAIENGGDETTAGIGVNYLQVCEEARGEDAAVAHAVARALRELLKGDRDRVSLEYPCHGPSAQRWFVMHALRRGDGKGVVVAHVDISEWKESS